MGSSAPDNVRRLVDRFDLNRDGYLSGSHNETQFRHEFSVMPADVLGQVYEQFLGEVIRLTAGHQAKVEEKPGEKRGHNP